MATFVARLVTVQPNIWIEHNVNSTLFALTTDANAQLPRDIPRRTGRWCVRKAGNAQGSRVLRMMDTLDLYACSTGYNARPKYRGGASTYSIQEKSRRRDEKRCQLDYVELSSRGIAGHLRHALQGLWRCK